MSNVQLELAVRLADDVRSLSLLPRLPAAEILLGTAELGLESKAIHARIDRLGREITMRLTRDLAERGTAVIPIVLDDCDVKLGLRGLPSVDFRGDYDEAVQRLVHTIAAPAHGRIDRPS